MRNRSILIALAATGSLLGACQKHSEPPPETQNVETPEPVAPPVATPPKPSETPTPKPAKPRAKAAPKPSADEQMLDDADATGMTSHSAPDTDPSGSSDPSGPTGNQQP